jgi:hypothetical protein
MNHEAQAVADRQAWRSRTPEERLDAAHAAKAGV